MGDALPAPSPVASRKTVLPPWVLTVGTLAPHCELCYLRGLFIIDGKGVLRQITINDLPVGRSVDEALRLVQAFQYTDEHGEGEPKPTFTCVHTWVHMQPLCHAHIHSLPALSLVWGGCEGPKEDLTQGLVCRKFLVWWERYPNIRVGSWGGNRNL